MEITITDKAAAEVKRLIGESTQHLRLRCVGGGCSGFQFKLALDDTINEKLDETFVFNDVNVVIDKRSAMYTDGTTIDYVDSDLSKKGFDIRNSRAKTTCGCGSSMSF